MPGDEAVLTALSRAESLPSIAYAVNVLSPLGRDVKFWPEIGRLSGSRAKIFVELGSGGHLSTRALGCQPSGSTLSCLIRRTSPLRGITTSDMRSLRMSSFHGFSTVCGLLIALALSSRVAAQTWPLLTPVDLPLEQILDPERSVPGSVSLGGPSRGQLLDGVRVEGANIELLPNYSERRTNFTSYRLLAILSAGAESMARCGQPVLRVGNFSVEGGGQLRWSRSHQSGRDADIAFPLRRRDGAVELPPALEHIDPDGSRRGDSSVSLDAAALWCLIDGMMESGGGELQWLFISRPLRQQVLRAGLDAGADIERVQMVAELLQQPSDSLPHDDHLHLRVGCAPADAREGCWSWGPQWEFSLDAAPLITRRLEALMADEDSALLRAPLAGWLAHGAGWRWWVSWAAMNRQRVSFDELMAVVEDRKSLGGSGAVLEWAADEGAERLSVALRALAEHGDWDADGWLSDVPLRQTLEPPLSLIPQALWWEVYAGRPIPALVNEALRVIATDADGRDNEESGAERADPAVTAAAQEWLSEWLGEVLDMADQEQQRWLEQSSRWSEDEVVTRLEWALARACDPPSRDEFCPESGLPDLDSADARWALEVLASAPPQLALLTDRWLVSEGLGWTPRRGWDQSRRARYWQRRADARGWGRPDLPLRAADE